MNRAASINRSAFTLMELLVVITLIGILAALVASATMRLVGVQEGKTTETNLLKLYSLLDQHWKAVIAKANSDTKIPPYAIFLASYDGNPNNPNNAQDSNILRRARVIHVKLSLQQHFPVRIFDLKGSPEHLADYPRLAVFIEAAKPTTKLSTTEMSSALLYLSLKQVRSGVTMDADTILNAMTLLPVQRVNGTDIPEMKIIADSWGKAIVFSRWPTDDLELNKNGPETGPWRDPEDPTGTLSDPLWIKPQPSTYAKFSQIAHDTGSQMSFKLTPVLMSAGPDKEYGLVTLDNSPQQWGSKPFASLKPDKTNPDPVIANGTNDNIYSYRLRLGGSGN